MNITQVKIRKLFHDQEKLRALVSIVVDGDLAIHDIKVIHSGDREFVAMPNRKEETGFRDIAHPIGPEAREALEQTVLEAYRAALKKVEFSGPPQAPEPSKAPESPHLP